MPHACHKLSLSLCLLSLDVTNEQMRKLDGWNGRSFDGLLVREWFRIYCITTATSNQPPIERETASVLALVEGTEARFSCWIRRTLACSVLVCSSVSTTRRCCKMMTPCTNKYVQ